MPLRGYRSSCNRRRRRIGKKARGLSHGRPQPVSANSSPLSRPLLKLLIASLPKLASSLCAIVRPASATRDPQGRIIEAYGFDLSPLAYRYDEFIRIAAEAKAERERMGQLKRRATCARRAIAQIGEILARHGSLPPAWPQLATETAELVAAIRKARSSTDLAFIAQSLESRKIQAQVWAKEELYSVEGAPRGRRNTPTLELQTYPFIFRIQ